MSHNAQAARQERLLTEPILPTLFGLGLPTMVVIVAQIGVSIIETFWISRLGTSALAGVTLVSPVLALIATMSNGGIGGGVSSAIARALGAGRHEDANSLLWHAVLLALGFGLAFTALLIGFGPVLYHWLGGRAEELALAVTFSNWVFAGSILLWLMNLLSAAMRGAGDVKVPAAVSLCGAMMLVPLSPALIFGWGPLPALGIAGAGIAVLIFYAGAVVFLVGYLVKGRSTLRLQAGPIRADMFQAILGVGLISALGTVVSNLTTVLVTGAVGIGGAVALAGYGVASRIDYLLIPLLFGFGTGVVTMIGVATGAGKPERVRAIGVHAAGVAFVATASIGAMAALFPQVWMEVFSDDPAVIEAGASYLRVAAPFYGFLGLGLMLYFASQGLGKMKWPFAGGVLRLLVSAAGAYLLVAPFGAIVGPAIAIAVGSVIFGLVNGFGFFKETKARA